MNSSPYQFTDHAKVPISREEWQYESEGQLAVDVAETQDSIVVVSTVAGASVGDIEVSLHNDLLTIRGVRLSPLAGQEVQHFYQECFWGKFSRTIVLPEEVRGEQALAEYKNGLLIVRIPKHESSRKIPVTIVEE